MFSRTDKELISVFERLKGRKDVSDLLEINDKSLRYFLYGRNTDSLYKTFEIPKRNGEKRQIVAPCKELKNIQRKIAYILNLVYKPKVCTCGFVVGKSIVDNAQKHVRKKLILNVDLKDFFTQINFGRVRGTFLSKPFSLGEEAATTLAQIVCYKGYLPQGAPTSPIISNLVCRSMDNQLMRIAKRNHVTYSRYADDLSFSTFTASFPKSIATLENGNIEIGNELISIFNDNSFQVNNSKTALMSPRVRQEVTGLTVNRKVNINRKYIKTIRAIIHNIKKTSIYDEAIKFLHSILCRNKKMIRFEDNKEVIEKWFEKVIIGKVRFIKQVKGKYDPFYIKYAKEANSAFKCELFTVYEEDNLLQRSDDSVFIIESEDSQGSCFYLDGFGLVTSAHVVEDKGFYSVYRYSNHEKIEFFPFNEEDMFINVDLDYAIFRKTKHDYKNYFPLAKSLNINIGERIKTIGYPEYCEKDSPNIQNTEVVSKTKHFGSELFTISGRLGHGSSGGVVLNEKNEVIGIIKSGISSTNMESDEGKHGFLPISIMVEDIKNQNIE